MKKIALIIFSLAVMTWPKYCLVWDDAEWCYLVKIADNKTIRFYGGPSSQINDMLSHPCGKSRVGGFSRIETADIHTSVWRLGCRTDDDGLSDHIDVYEDSSAIIVYDDSSNIKHFIYDKGKVVRALRALHKTADYIKVHRKDFDWNP